ncbi:MAG: hypothetical protein ACLUBZ_17005 [Ruthenibacterium lactatiformans]|uniref:hypothetical protein n=1 Tax=Ruthenibacterium lactatiformans TaxID=1550024 RepID=UPI003992BDB1
MIIAVSPQAKCDRMGDAPGFWRAPGAADGDGKQRCGVANMPRRQPHRVVSRSGTRCAANQQGGW